MILIILNLDVVLGISIYQYVYRNVSFGIDDSLKNL